MKYKATSFDSTKLHVGVDNLSDIFLLFHGLSLLSS